MSTGACIVFDGNDGSGKQTQATRLITRLEQEGEAVVSLDFPRYYDTFFGQLIADGQCGEYGDWLSLDPHLTSVFYAADRFETAPLLREYIDNGYVVLLDRYVSANQIHQGGKIADPDERTAFLKWLDRMEHEVFNLPRPDQIIYFDVPEEISLENLKEKKPERYAAGRSDVTEGDMTYLTNSRTCAKWLAEDNDRWHIIDCYDHTAEAMRSVEDIHEDVYTHIKTHI